MKILYDHQSLSLFRTGGVARYFAELLREFDSFKEIEVEVSILLTQNKYLLHHKSLSKKVILSKTHIRGLPRFIYRLNRLNTLRLLSKEDYDIFHPTFYDPYFLKYIKDKPFALTVYDCAHERLPDFFGSKIKAHLKEKAILIERAKRIIAISENTKRDIIELYKVREEKIEVVYLGYRSYDNNALANFHTTMPENYLLFVGMRGGYKNFLFFLNAISELLKEKNNLFLLCAGGGKFNETELKEINRLRISDKVKQFEFEENELDIIYRKAKLFVYPSLYEGFGLPIIEAFNNDCPVACSNINALSEIADHAALFFNPLDENDIKLSIRKLINQEDLKNNLINNARSVRKQFTWHNTALKTLDVYNNILNY